jgi:hypothetical protein
MQATPLTATHGEERLRLSFFAVLADWIGDLGKEQIKESNKRTGSDLY